MGQPDRFEHALAEIARLYDMQNAELEASLAALADAGVATVEVDLEQLRRFVDCFDGGLNPPVARASSAIAPYAALARRAASNRFALPVGRC